MLPNEAGPMSGSFRRCAASALAEDEHHCGSGSAYTGKEDTLFSTLRVQGCKPIAEMLLEMSFLMLEQAKPERDLSPIRLGRK